MALLVLPSVPSDSQFSPVLPNGNTLPSLRKSPIGRLSHSLAPAVQLLISGLNASDVS